MLTSVSGIAHALAEGGPGCVMMLGDRVSYRAEEHSIRVAKIVWERCSSCGEEI